LLRHARDSGCAVFEGVTVTETLTDGQGWSVHLGRHGRTRCRVLVDASGRERKRGATAKDNDMLLRHRNVAFWCHVVDGKPAQTLQGEWNIFREPGLSPIGNFAFDDGWFWYIPVPMQVNGERRLTHSLGIVTHPDTLRRAGARYHRSHDLLATARSLPLLGELVANARPIHQRTLSATNYSMINRDICDYASGRIAVGDAAYFVDPLFSSGVSFALLHAAAAALVIRSTFDPSIPPAMKREAWADYQENLQEFARSFALGIDQWYAAIARDNPDSSHWRGLAEYGTLPVRRQTFQALVNVGLSSDLIRVTPRAPGTSAALVRRGP
jgi:flavin-dependent dehydrogenase